MSWRRRRQRISAPSRSKQAYAFPIPQLPAKIQYNTYSLQRKPHESHNPHNPTHFVPTPHAGLRHGRQLLGAHHPQICKGPTRPITCRIDPLVSMMITPTQAPCCNSGWGDPFFFWPFWSRPLGSPALFCEAVFIPIFIKKHRLAKANRLQTLLHLCLMQANQQDWRARKVMSAANLYYYYYIFFLKKSHPARNPALLYSFPHLSRLCPQWQPYPLP